MPALARSVAVRLRAEMDGFRKEWREAGDEAERAGDKIKAGGRKASEAARPISELEGTVARTSARLKNHRAEWDAVGTTMLRTGAVIAGAGLLMTKAAMDWESQWAGVTKTVEGTPAQLAQVEAGLRGLAKTLPESHEGIAAVAEAAGQLGIATGDVVDFTRVMVMLGDTTNLTADEAATSIAQLMNIMGTAPDKVDELASTLVYLGNRGASTEAQILGMAQRIASAGATVGLAESDVLGLANAVASTGIEVEAGGSAISNVLIDMAKAVDSGGDKLDKFASVAGMSADQFRQAWESDPAMALVAFTEGLGAMEASGESAFQALDQLGQSDIRVTRALLNLANAGDLARSSLADGSAEWERNNALAQEAEKRYDTASARAEIAWNNIKDNAIDAGQAMLPIVSEIADLVSTLAGAFGSLPPVVTGGVGALALFGGGALLLVGGLMKAAGAVSDFRTNLTNLQVDAPRSGKALGLLTKAFAALTAAAAAGAALQGWDKGKFDVGGVNEFTRGLLKAADGSDKLLNSLSSADATGLRIGSWGANNVDGLADAFDKAAESKGKLDLTFASDSGWERSARILQQIDAALTSTVASGDMQRVGEMMAYLRTETGRSSKELENLLPAYRDAMEGVRLEQKAAADSAKDAAGGVQYMADALTRTGLSGDEAADAVREAADATKDASLSMVDSLAVIDQDTTLSSYIADLEEAAAAQAEWADNMVKAAARGVNTDVLAKLQEEGPAAAGVLKELADGSQESIDKLNDLYSQSDQTAGKLAELRAVVGDEILMQFDVKGEKDAVGKILDVVAAKDLVPDQVQTIMEALDFATEDIEAVLDGMTNLDQTRAHPSIRALDNASGTIGDVGGKMRGLDGTRANPRIGVDPGNSFSIINGIQTSINRITGKTVYVKVAQQGGTPGGITQSYTGRRVPRGFAGGGKVPGVAPSDPTVDNVMAYGASTGTPMTVRSGEWIINEPQSRKNDEWLAAVNSGLVIDELMAQIASSIIAGPPRKARPTPMSAPAGGSAHGSLASNSRWAASRAWQDTAQRAPAGQSGVQLIHVASPAPTGHVSRPIAVDGATFAYLVEDLATGAAEMVMADRQSLDGHLSRLGTS